MTRSASSFFPVTMMMGIVDSARTLLASSMPSSPVRRRSSTITSIACSASTRVISSPVATVVTRNSFSPRYSARRPRIAGSSSTARMCGATSVTPPLVVVALMVVVVALMT